MTTQTGVGSQLIHEVEDARAGLVDFLGALIRAPSVNPPGDERAVAEQAREELARLGLPEPEMHQPSPGRPNLICRIDGRRPGRTLILNGHLDTKPPGDLDAWATDPFTPTIKDGLMFGLGASDMKGGVAAMVFAAAALARRRDRWDGSLVLALTADEEAGGREGAERLVRDGRLAGDFAVIGEPAGISRPWESLYTGTRGLCVAWIRVYGTQSHASLADYGAPVKAAIKAAALQLRFDRDFVAAYAAELVRPGGLGLYPGLIVRGGVAAGVMPPWIEFMLDLRIPPGVTRAAVEHALRDFLAQAMREDPSLQAVLTFAPPPVDWRDPLAIPEGEHAVDALADVVQQILGRRLTPAVFPAWTDSLWLQGLGGIPTVPALGPGLLGVSHSPNEYVALDDVIAAAKIYGLFGLRFLSGEGDG